MNKKLSVSCYATGGPFGSGVYEIHDENNKYVGYCAVSKLKEKGLVKRIDHTKKAEEFLNTDEGREWFMKNRTFSSAYI